MQAISYFRPQTIRMPAISVNWTSLAFLAIAVLTVLAAMSGANAAGVTGLALKPAFDVLNDIVGGYGKQLLVLVGFIAACFGIVSTQATGAILKFIGYTIFLGVALGAALALSGAVI